MEPREIEFEELPGYLFGTFAGTPVVIEIEAFDAEGLPRRVTWLEGKLSEADETTYETPPPVLLDQAIRIGLDDEAAMLVPQDEFMRATLLPGSDVADPLRRIRIEMLSAQILIRTLESSFTPQERAEFRRRRDSPD